MQFHTHTDIRHISMFIAALFVGALTGSSSKCLPVRDQQSLYINKWDPAPKFITQEQTINTCNNMQQLK